MRNLSYKTLADIGINPLTGEACAYSMRLLCDLNEAGACLVADYLGIDRAGFRKPWNTSVGGDPAVASVMLECETFGALMRFALFREGFEYIYETSGAFRGGDLLGFSEVDIEKDPGLVRRIEEEFGSRLYRNPVAQGRQDRQGSRNVHAFTGRAT